MAVNGARNFAAVLDARGVTLECVDLEIEDHEENDDGDIEVEAEGANGEQDISI
jgi:hypothetical protein